MTPWRKWEKRRRDASWDEYRVWRSEHEPNVGMRAIESEATQLVLRSVPRGELIRLQAEWREAFAEAGPGPTLWQAPNWYRWLSPPKFSLVSYLALVLFVPLLFLAGVSSYTTTIMMLAGGFVWFIANIIGFVQGRILGFEDGAGGILELEARRRKSDPHGNLFTLMFHPPPAPSQSAGGRPRGSFSGTAETRRQVVAEARELLGRVPPVPKKALMAHVGWDWRTIKGWDEWKQAERDTQVS